MMKKFVKVILIVLILIMAMSILSAVAADVAVGDPSGLNTGSAYDITAVTPGSPTLQEVSEQVGKNKLGINYVWILLTGCLIFFFQAGFCHGGNRLYEGKKCHAYHVYELDGLFSRRRSGTYLVGFALQFGGFGGSAALGAGSAVLNGELGDTGTGRYSRNERLCPHFRRSL